MGHCFVNTVLGHAFKSMVRDEVVESFSFALGIGKPGKDFSPERLTCTLDHVKVCGTTKSDLDHIRPYQRNSTRRYHLENVGVAGVRARIVTRSSAWTRLSYVSNDESYKRNTFT